MIEVGSECRIRSVGDRYDNIRCVVTSDLEYGDCSVEFLEATIDHEIGYIGIFSKDDLMPISALELLAEAAE